MFKKALFLLVLLIIPFVHGITVYENQTNQVSLSSNSKLMIDVCGIDENNSNEMFNIDVTYSLTQWNDPPLYTKNNVQINIVPFTSEIFNLNANFVQGVCNARIETDLTGLVNNNILKQSVVWYTPSNIYPLLTGYTENKRTLYFMGGISGIYALAYMNFTPLTNTTYITELITNISSLNNNISNLMSTIRTQNATINTLSQTCNLSNVSINVSRCPEITIPTCPTCPDCNCQVCPTCQTCGDPTLTQCRTLYSSECLFLSLDKCREQYGGSCTQKEVCPDCNNVTILQTSDTGTKSKLPWIISGICGLIVVIVVIKNVASLKKKKSEKPIGFNIEKKGMFSQEENPFNFLGGK